MSFGISVPEWFREQAEIREAVRLWWQSVSLNAIEYHDRVTNGRWIQEMPDAFGTDWDQTVKDLVRLVAETKKAMGHNLFWDGSVCFNGESGYVSFIKFKASIELDRAQAVKIKMEHFTIDEFGYHRETKTHICRLA